MYFCRMQKRILFFLSLIMLGCSHDPYKASNKVYKRETKEFSNVIRQEPANYFAEQNTEWVGAMNFDLRKPNFVIIHHTAQKSCPETLHTFTIRQSQVS